MAQDSQSNNGLSMSGIADKEFGGSIVSRIKRKNAIIGVVGLGQVGLPTALSFAKVGYRIIGYDTNSRLIEDLSNGITSIAEQEVKNLLVTGLSQGKILFGSDKCRQCNWLKVTAGANLLNLDFDSSLTA